MAAEITLQVLAAAVWFFAGLTVSHTIRQCRELLSEAQAKPTETDHLTLDQFPRLQQTVERLHRRVVDLENRGQTK